MNNLRIFNTSNELKKLWVSGSDLERLTDMMENTMIHLHANQMITTLDQIITSMTKNASINEQDVNNLIELGKQHYYFGLKKDHFKVKI
jgi:hypothetical protein